MKAFEFTQLIFLGKQKINSLIHSSGLVVGLLFFIVRLVSQFILTIFTIYQTILTIYQIFG